VSTPDRRDFLLPDLGEGLTEGQVVEWLVQVGDRVSVDQPVARIETAKAVAEVPVPFEGVVVALHAGPGDTVAVGQPLLSVGPAPHEGSGAVLVGSGTAEPPRRRATRRPAPPLPPGDRPRVVSPVVRRLAAEHGLDLAGVAGSGPAGLVTRKDVESAIAGAGPGDGSPDGEPPARRLPLSASRRAMVERLSRSRREIPEATVWVDADATALLEAREALAAANPGVRVSVLCLLARFCVAGLVRHPELNATFDPEAGEVVQYPWVHLGFAAQTPRGLMVPVVRHAERRNLVGLAGELERLAAGARNGSLSPSDLAGGTFTVNNYGIYGVDGSAAIINHPEAAILGLGRIEERPWVVGGQLAVRKVTQLTLAFDHRVCDGEPAGRFLRFVADCVENPVVALGHL